MGHSTSIDEGLSISLLHCQSVIINSKGPMNNYKYHNRLRNYINYIKQCRVLSAVHNLYNHSSRQSRMLNAFRKDKILNKEIKISINSLFCLVVYEHVGRRVERVRNIADMTITYISTVKKHKFSDVVLLVHFSPFLNRILLGN